jgi:hypothetical protein
MEAFMAQFGDCPIGFEDGHIASYEADADCLLVNYEFWNEKHGKFSFEGFLAMRDNNAIDVIIGSTKQIRSSELLTTVLRHQYTKLPEEWDLMHYQFLDVDDTPVFEVVAKACHFTEVL